MSDPLDDEEMTAVPLGPFAAFALEDWNALSPRRCQWNQEQ
jgi:hypothetical protein